MRPGSDNYENVAKLLMTLTLTYPQYPIENLEKGEFPKIYTVFTNFSPNQA